MGSNTRTSKKKKQIDKLKTELISNDEVLKKNKEETKKQIQIGLYQKGYPQTSPMYDSLLVSFKLELEELNIRLKSGFKVINPMFEYQKDKRWIEIQKEFTKKNINALNDRIKEIETKVEETEKELIEQNTRIKLRRVQILEELKGLNVDVSEFLEKSPNYIG